MRTFFVLFIMLFAGINTAIAQDFDAMFTETETTNNSETGVNWATMTGDTVTLKVNGIEFSYPTARFTSGKSGLIVVKAPQNFLYFHSDQLKNGVLQPLGETGGFPVFRNHKGKFFQLRIGNDSGQPYSRYASSSGNGN